MKDDSLNDTHVTRPGGYCPMCDTVYDRPHECVGTYPNELTKEQYDYAKERTDETRKLWSDDSKLRKEIWNEAIEAAAVMLSSSYQDNVSTNAFCAAIRSLKK